MQIYIPLTVSDLQAATPPNKKRIAVPTDVEDEDYDEVSEEARDEAAFLSLEMARDAQDVPTRLVLSAEVARENAALETWADTDSIYVDDKDGRELCAAAAASTTQAEADEALHRLVEQPLMWADVSERASLYRHLVAGEPWQ